ncbi:amidohydrolase [uncultured Acinetobacter sp.]|uniref:amidohydrolase n=1 Tax=uncultured Acinetobacter sp. TaxID=165433 RepID=UPI00258DCB09|nr:amidohydrolase [uncultured Acinetobacter sp.]
MSNIVYYNTKIYTVNESQPWAEAMWVKAGKILAIGDQDELLALAEGAEHYDLAGKMVMPGIHDAHTHLLKAALRRLEYSCELNDPQTLDELAQQLKTYWAKYASERTWIFAGLYNPLIFTADILTREWLDQVIPHVPIVIHDFSFHNVMANSLALDLAGISRDTPSTIRAKIEKDPVTGEPTGILREGAWVKLYMAAPTESAEQNKQALKMAASICNQYGITSAQEASATRPFLIAAQTLDEAQELTLDLFCHLPWRAEVVSLSDREEDEQVIAQREQYASKRVMVNGIKVMLDGTSMAPTFSHVPLDPVTDQPITYNLLLDSNELTEKIREWTKADLIVKAHCTGYGSVRIALNNYENANHIERKAGHFHDIAHAHYVSLKDRPRFGELGIIAEMSPAIWHIPEYQQALGKAYDFRSLYEAGAVMTVGTDWLLPPTPNLFPALAGILQHGDESVPLEVALQMMTLNGAIAIGHRHRTGSLEMGKDATFIVLDRNIFESTVEEIAATQVITTVLQGQHVFQRTS